MKAGSFEGADVRSISSAVTVREGRCRSISFDGRDVGAFLIGDYEDPQCIYDSEAGKWRMLLCENQKAYKAAIRESDQWDGTYEKTWARWPSIS